MSPSETVTLESGRCTLYFSAIDGKLERFVYASPDGNKRDLLLLRPQQPALRGEWIPEDRLADRFTIFQAWGADECFPSVAGNVSHFLRDHGWIWGAPVRQEKTTEDIKTEWQVPCGDVVFREVSALPPREGVLAAFSFSLSFPSDFRTHLADGSLLRVRSLYASHALFAAETGDRVKVFENLAQSESLNPQAFWANVFPPADEPTAQKLYLEASETPVTVLERPSLGIRIRVIQEEGLPCVGIWWCNNAWGDGREHRTVGIEPTNISSDGPVFVSHEALERLGNKRTFVQFRYEILPLAE